MNRICVFEKGDLKETNPTMFMGPAFTFFVDERVTAVVGLAIIWPGVASVWSVIKDVRGHNFWFHRNAKRLLNETSTAWNIHRIQAAVSVKDPKAVKLIKSLGFHKESIMKKFGTDKTDYFYFVRF